MTPHEQFFADCAGAARSINAPFPEMQASEAMLESAWGASQLAREANNVLGIKQHSHFGDVLTLPTREWIEGRGFVVVNAEWAKYPTIAACFIDRMAILHRVHLYAAALAATDAESFVRAVSAHWSTDPHRADKVLAIYRAVVNENHAGLKEINT